MPDASCLIPSRLLSAILLLFVAWGAPISSALADEAQDKYDYAVGLTKQSRWQLAADQFREFLKEYPEHPRVPQAQMHLGLNLINLGQYGDARDVFRRFLTDYPNNRNRALALFRSAECSYLLNDLQPAVADLRRFVNDYPDSSMGEWAYVYLGEAQLRSNDAESAVSSLEKSLELFPQGRMADEAKFHLARSLDAAGNDSRALDLYREIVTQKGTRAAQAQFQLATLLFESDRHGDAAREYDELVNRFANSDQVPLARINSGYAYFQLGNYDEALARFESAAEDEAQEAKARYWKGQSLRLLKRYDSAQSEFAHVNEHWPDAEFAADALHFASEMALKRAILADGEQKQSLLDETQQLLTQFQQDFPNSPLRFSQALLHGQWLLAKEEAANLKPAEQQFRDVLEKSQNASTQAWARYFLAVALQKQGNHSEVDSVLKPLLERAKSEGPNSQFVESLSLAGISLVAEEHFEQAEPLLTQYLTWRPKGESAEQVLAARAVTYANLEQAGSADTDLRRLAGDFPESTLIARTTHRLAELAYAQEDWARSRMLFDALAQMGEDSPYHAAAISGVAWSQFQQKEFDDSAKNFETIVKRYGDDEKLAHEAAYMHGRALQAAARSDEAIAAYTLALDKHRDRHEGYLAGLQAARLLSRQKEVSQADATYQKLLEYFPEPANLDYLLEEWALMHYEAGDFDRADAIFRRLVSEVPNSELADNARFSLAESDLLAGKLDAAAKTFRDLSNDKQSDEDVQQDSLFRLIGIEVERENWRQVQRDANELERRFPMGRHHWDALYYLSESRLALGDPQGAIQSLELLKGERNNSLVTRAEWFPHVWVALAKAHFQRKQYDQVADAVEELRSRDPESPVLYRADEVLGRSLKNQARFDKSRDAFERVVNSTAGRRTETAAKCQLLLAETYFIEKDYEKALEGYLKVYHLYKFPEWQAPALFQAAICDEFLEHWPQAAESYQELIDKFPNSEFAEKAKPRAQAAQRKSDSG